MQQSSAPSPIEWGVGFLIVGGVVAILTPFAAALFPYEILPAWWILVCPPSVASIGLENMGAVAAWVVWALIVVLNGAIYFAAGFAGGLFLGKRSPPSSSASPPPD